MHYSILFLLLLPGYCLAQGPLDGYLKGRGHLDLAPSFSFNSARDFIGAEGQRYATPYRGSMLGLFATYGLQERLDLVATAAYVFTERQSGWQDGGLFVKYRPVYTELGASGKLGILLGTGLSFPIGNYQPTATGALGQRATVVPARLIVQWETPIGLFVNLTGGYNWRLDALRAEDVATVRQARPDYQPLRPRNFTTALLKIGFPSRHTYFDAWLEWQHTTGGANYQPDVVDLPQAYGVSYTQVGGTAYYSESTRTGFYVSTGYILGGRNTSRLVRLTGGLVFKF